jgi:hypothetical protein
MFQSLPSTISQSGKLHTTPPSDKEAEEQVLPVPIEDVHGLSPEAEQLVILEPESLMSIMVSELIMMTEPASDLM